MAKRKRKPKIDLVAMTPEREAKPDVLKRPGRRSVVKSYAEILMGRGALTKRQVDTWTKIEKLAEWAQYGAGPKSSNFDPDARGSISDPGWETERYIRARHTLKDLFQALGKIGTSVVEFMVIMGEDAETFSRRMPNWNRHKVMGALCVALDVAGENL